MNEDIGLIRCTTCNSDAPIRKNKRGKLYWNCPHCGLIVPNLQKGQDYILNNGRFFDDHGDLPSVPDPDPPADVEPVQDETPPPRRSMWDDL